MKKRSQKIMLSVCIVCIVISVRTVAKNSEKKNESIDLFMRNIEALASGENENLYTCYGIGSVDCPDGIKVKGILSRLTLEF